MSTSVNSMAQWLVGMVLWGVAGTAAAQGADLGLATRAVAPVGQKPALVLQVRRAVTRVTVTLQRSDGKTVVLKTGALPAGKDKELPLEQPEGTFHYQGSVAARFTGDAQDVTLPVAFDASVLRPPQLSVTEEDLHLDDNRVEVTMDRAARKLSYRVVGEEGTEDRGDVDLLDLAPGSKLTVNWNPTVGRVMRIDMVGHDIHGMYSPTLQLFPWSLDIPHEEVLFPTGQSVIPPEELGKVQTAVAEVQTAVKRYGKVVSIKLFVAGHTDTVGAPETNQALSEARAQSIARAFRKLGVRVPIRYQGFGESVPKVSTPDETEEPANRRAEYTLSVEEPRGQGQGRWTAVP